MKYACHPLNTVMRGSLKEIQQLIVVELTLLLRPNARKGKLRELST